MKRHSRIRLDCRGLGDWGSESRSGVLMFLTSQGRGGVHQPRPFIPASLSFICNVAFTPWIHVALVLIAYSLSLTRSVPLARLYTLVTHMTKQREWYVFKDMLLMDSIFLNMCPAMMSPPGLEALTLFFVASRRCAGGHEGITLGGVMDWGSSSSFPESRLLFLLPLLLVLIMAGPCSLISGCKSCTVILTTCFNAPAASSSGLMKKKEHTE
uniref:Uncharacterized protein n=1 Tax=Timema douglasi TaxID=61478 RepID=A0A7R8VF76_TIMDO|nr:unnamed protein product [Timema douglasi]